jgi:hypothetical protein
MVDRSPAEIKLIAAHTVLNGERQALQSFRSNNKRQMPYDLLEGLDAFKLLSQADRQMLIKMSELLPSPEKTSLEA